MGKTNTDWAQMTDAAIVARIGEFIKHTRMKQRKTQAQLAAEAGLNRWTVSQMEKGESITLSSLIPLLRALDVLYVLDRFQVREEISPLAYAKLKKQQRQERVRTPSSKEGDQEDVGW